MNLLGRVNLLKENEVAGAGAFNPLARLIKYFTSSSGDIELNTNHNGGIDIALNSNLRNKLDSAEPEYDGPFAVKLSEDKKKLHINGGWINRNGDFLSMSGETVDTPPSGKYVCVYTNIVVSSANGARWANPEFRFSSSPSITMYPIAFFTGDKVVNFRVPVAVFVMTATCPVIVNK